MEKEIKKVYTGTLIEAEFITKVLEDNNIQFLLRNFQEESLVAGWAGGGIIGNEAASVYVFNEDYDDAMSILDEISHSDAFIESTEE